MPLYRSLFITAEIRNVHANEPALTNSLSSLKFHESLVFSYDHAQMELSWRSQSRLTNRQAHYSLLDISDRKHFTIFTERIVVVEKNLFNDSGSKSNVNYSWLKGTKCVNRAVYLTRIQPAKLNITCAPLYTRFFHLLVPFLSKKENRGVASYPRGSSVIQPQNVDCRNDGLAGWLCWWHFMLPDP